MHRILFFCWLLLLVPVFAGDDLRALVDSDPDKAERLLRDALTDPAKAGEANMLLSMLYGKKGNLDQSIDHAKKAVRDLPTSSEAHYVYAQALRRKISKNPMFAMANTGRYMQNLDKAIELDRTNYGAWQEKIGFLLNAPPIAGGSVEKARALADELVELDQISGLASIARIHGKNKAYNEQLKVYERLCAMDAANPNHLLGKGLTLQRLKRYQEAAAWFDNSYGAHPDTPMLLYQAARSRILGDLELDRAAELLTRYVTERPKWKSGPTVASGLWRLGTIHEKQGKKEEAIKAYENALELEPDHKQAKASLEKLK